MSHATSSWNRFGRRTMTLAAACALGVSGTLALTASAAETDSTEANPTAPRCSTATLKGLYLFSGDGWSVSATGTTPMAFAGSERFDGRGGVRGNVTFSQNGTIIPKSSYTSTYTINPDCTGTQLVDGIGHYDIYVAPSGDSFTFIQTDPGSVTATTETRATRA
jgi:hypothetical protein